MEVFDLPIAADATPWSTGWNGGSFENMGRAVHRSMCEYVAEAHNLHCTVGVAYQILSMHKHQTLPRIGPARTVGGRFGKESWSLGKPYRWCGVSWQALVSIKVGDEHRVMVEENGVRPQQPQDLEHTGSLAETQVPDTEGGLNSSDA
jgi:hypothetical protein